VTHNPLGPRESYDEACRVYLSLCFALASRIERGDEIAIKRLQRAADDTSAARWRLVH